LHRDHFYFLCVSHRITSSWFVHQSHQRQLVAKQDKLGEKWLLNFAYGISLS
jgi:hypothetical protein